MNAMKPFRDTQPMHTTTWTVPMARNALNDLEMGYLHRAGMLADAMTRDDRIAAVLRTRVRALLGLDRTIISSSDIRPARKIAAALEQDFDLMAGEDTIAALMRWSVLLGVGIAEARWERVERTGDTSRWIPRLKVWHPQFLQYRWDTSSWWLTTLDGMIEIQPGNGQWVVLQLASQRPWMEGLVRELAIPYLIRQFAMRDWARYSEDELLRPKSRRDYGGSFLGH
jgi:phage gp29-like protein